MLLTGWGEHWQRGADHRLPARSRDRGADYVWISCLPGRFSLPSPGKLRTIGKHVAFGNEANLLNGLWTLFFFWVCPLLWVNLSEGRQPGKPIRRSRRLRLTFTQKQDSEFACRPWDGDLLAREWNPRNRPVKLTICLHYWSKASGRKGRR